MKGVAISVFRLFKPKSDHRDKRRTHNSNEKPQWAERHDLELFRSMVSDCMDELPEAFFRELSGGVIVSEEAPVPEYAKANDLMTLGLYTVGRLGRQVTIYYGSFVRMFPHLSNEDLREHIRGVVRHEFRHHMEFLSGIHNSQSLEAEDIRQMQRYLAGE